MDVKPWDDETDMKKLEEAVRSVELEGLHWGQCMVYYSNIIEIQIEYKNSLLKI